MVRNNILSILINYLITISKHIGLEKQVILLDEDIFNLKVFKVTGSYSWAFLYNTNMRTFKKTLSRNGISSEGLLKEAVCSMLLIAKFRLLGAQWDR